MGICGLVIGDDDYVVLAVDGLQGDRATGGYLAEIAQLFTLWRVSKTGYGCIRQDLLWRLQPIS